MDTAFTELLRYKNRLQVEQGSIKWEKFLKPPKGPEKLDKKERTKEQDIKQTAEAESNNFKNKIVEEVIRKFNIEKQKAEEILKFLEISGLCLKTEYQDEEPRLTVFKMSSVQSGVAKNLVLHGHKVFTPDDQTKTNNKQNKKYKGMKTSAWFVKQKTVL